MTREEILASFAEHDVDVSGAALLAARARVSALVVQEGSGIIGGAAGGLATVPFAAEPLALMPDGSVAFVAERTDGSRNPVWFPQSRVHEIEFR